LPARPGIDAAKVTVHRPHSSAAAFARKSKPDYVSESGLAPRPREGRAFPCAVQWTPRTNDIRPG